MTIARTLAVVVLFTIVVSADTLYLRSGQRLQGHLISIRNDVIEFEEQSRGVFGGTRLVRVNRDEVARIDLDEGGSAGSAPFGPRRPAGLRERSVDVVASQAWTDTGIDVRSGQTVYFEASGLVRWGPHRRDGPAGESGSPPNPARPIPNRPAAALIGRIGADSHDYFLIGDERGPVRMRASGRLFLGINDDYLEDNSGSFRVVVYY